MYKLLEQVDRYKKVNPNIRTYLGARKASMKSLVLYQDLMIN